MIIKLIHLSKNISYQRIITGLQMASLLCRPDSFVQPWWIFSQKDLEI
jgi:hypothetical protein